MVLWILIGSTQEDAPDKNGYRANICHVLWVSLEVPLEDASDKSGYLANIFSYVVGLIGSTLVRCSR